MTPEQLYEELLAQISYDVPETGTVITKSVLEGMIGEELEHSDVYNRDEELTKSFGHLSRAYGFESFYPFFVMTEMNEMEKLEKAGNKDFSRLHKVKRTVIRNGKPMQTTIYSDPGEDKQDNDLDEGQPKTSKGSALTSARDMTSSSYHGSNGSNWADISGSSKGLKTREGDLVSPESFLDVTGAFTLTDELGNPRATVGFGEDERYVFIQFIADDDETTGIGLKSFFELLAFAKTQDKGLIMSDTVNPLALNLFAQYGLTKRREGYWAVTRKNLNEKLGDLPWLSV